MEEYGFIESGGIGMDKKYDSMEGLTEDFKKVLGKAEKVEGSKLAYFWIHLPNKITGYVTHPEDNDYFCGLRIPVKEGELNLKDSLERIYEGEIKDESGSENPRYKVGNTIVQYTWPRKDVIELFTTRSEEEEDFEDKRRELVQLANSLFETLQEDGNIRVLE